MSAAATSDLRTFVAVELPAEVKRAIAGEQARVQAALADQGLASTLRWSPVDNIHLTLRFLGDTTPAQQRRLIDGLSAAAHDWSPFALSTGRLGCFPTCRAPRVFWQGIEGDLDALSVLQAGVERLVQGVGFAAEERAFSPHLTLARARRESARPALQETGRALTTLAAEPQPPAISFTVNHIVYFQSDLRAGGSVYTPLAVILFGRGSAR
jgi:2'-5' RNA ligase